MRMSVGIQCCISIRRVNFVGHKIFILMPAVMLETVDYRDLAMAHKMLIAIVSQVAKAPEKMENS